MTHAPRRAQGIDLSHPRVFHALLHSILCSSTRSQARAVFSMQNRLRGDCESRKGDQLNPKTLNLAVKIYLPVCQINQESAHEMMLNAIRDLATRWLAGISITVHDIGVYWSRLREHVLITRECLVTPPPSPLHRPIRSIFRIAWLPCSCALALCRACVRSIIVSPLDL